MNRSRHSLEKSDVSDSLVIQANCSQKASESLKITYFLYVFDSFSSFLCTRENCSQRSSLIRSFLKSDLSDSLPVLSTKEQG